MARRPGGFKHSTEIPASGPLVTDNLREGAPQGSDLRMLPWRAPASH